MYIISLYVFIYEDNSIIIITILYHGRGLPMSVRRCTSFILRTVRGGMAF